MRTQTITIHHVLTRPPRLVSGKGPRVYPQVVDRAGEVPVVTRRLQERNESIDARPAGAINGSVGAASPAFVSSQEITPSAARVPSSKWKKQRSGRTGRDVTRRSLQETRGKHASTKRESGSSSGRLRVKVKARRGRSFRAAANRRANNHYNFNNSSASVSEDGVVFGRRRLGMSGAAVTFKAFTHFLKFSLSLQEINFRL